MDFSSGLGSTLVDDAVFSGRTPITWMKFTRGKRSPRNQLAGSKVHRTSPRAFRRNQKAIQVSLVASPLLQTLRSVRSQMPLRTETRTELYQIACRRSLASELHSNTAGSCTVECRCAGMFGIFGVPIWSNRSNWRSSLARTSRPSAAIRRSTTDWGSHAFALMGQKELRETE